MPMSMPIGDLDELSYDVEADGVLVRKQLERVILARGAWATVMFLFQELDPETNAFRAPKIAIVRFQKWRGGYRKHAAITVAGEAAARELGAVLARWSTTMQADDARDQDGDGDGDGDHGGRPGAEA